MKIPYILTGLDMFAAWLFLCVRDEVINEIVDTAEISYQHVCERIKSDPNLLDERHEIILSRFLEIASEYR